MSPEVQSCLNLLRELAELADHATLTGSLAGGERRAVRRYNAALRILEDEGVVADGLFEPLPEEAGYGEVGVEAKTLVSVVDRPEKSEKPGRRDLGDPDILVRLAPFVRGEDLAAMVQESLRQGQGITMETVTHLAPFLNQDSLSEILRDHIPRRSEASRAPEPPRRTPEPPVPPTAPVVPAPETAIVPAPASPEEGLTDLLDALRRPDLDPAERDRLLEEIRVRMSYPMMALMSPSSEE